MHFKQLFHRLQDPCRDVSLSNLSTLWLCNDAKSNSIVPMQGKIVGKITKLWNFLFCLFIVNYITLLQRKHASCQCFSL
jgi:hypothetical protein